MKKFTRNPWILGVGTAAMGGVLATLVVDRIKAIDFLSTLMCVLKFIGNIFISFLNFELKVWWVLAAIAILFLIVYAKILHTETVESPPSFLTYTKESELGYTWEWRYTKTYDGKYTISNLHPVCSKCGMILKQSGTYGEEMRCLRCGTTQKWEEVYLTDAQMLIEDNIKKNYLQNQ